jgi:hypothetical protein
MEKEHEQVVASASSGLSRAATALGAEVIALLETAGSQVLVTSLWSCARDHAPQRQFIEWRRLPAEAIGARAVTRLSAGSPLAALLRDLISQRSQSFLLVPWQGAPQALTGVIGFRAPDPPVGEVPEPVVENLRLLGWTDWSAREIVRLRAELKTVNERLAGRKLVERAKSTLQADLSINEDSAYQYLRSQSRRRRITLAALSAEIVSGRGGHDPAVLSQTERDLTKELDTRNKKRHTPVN